MNEQKRAERRREEAARATGRRSSPRTDAAPATRWRPPARRREVGPDLDEVLKGKDAEFVRASIVDPDAEVAAGFQPGIMPETFDEQLSDEQLDALVKYLLDSTKGG